MSDTEIKPLKEDSVARQERKKARREKRAKKQKRERDDVEDIEEETQVMTQNPKFEDSRREETLAPQPKSKSRKKSKKSKSGSILKSEVVEPDSAVLRHVDPIQKKSDEVGSKITNEVTKCTPWNDWSKSSFNGDQGRKSKFLRLLGSSKGTNRDTNISTNRVDAITNEKEINRQMLKQFEDSKEIQKSMRTGKRIGLGFS